MGVFDEFLASEYLGILITLLAVFFTVRIFIYVISVVLPKLTAKTKTNLDDEILDKVSGPITWIAMFIGVRVLVGRISFLEPYEAIAESCVMTVIILFGAVLIYHLLDVVLTVGFNNFGKRSGIDLDISLIQFFESIVKILVFVGAFLIVLSTWGIEIGPLLAGLGVAGIAIAFALQSTLSNVFGGISMLLDNSINVGDLIKLEDGTSGKIEKINLRSTKMITFDNELVIVPNAKLADSNIQNIALPEPKTRVVIPFGVAYGSDIEKVKKLILKEVKKIKNIEKDPKPHVKFLEMANSSLNFNAYFYVKTYDDRLTAKDEANTLIYNALNKAKIEIPFPQMDVHVKK